jgi:6-phosphogluconolactonase
MTNHTIRLFEDTEALSEAAANEFLRLAREAVASRGRFTVALSGGSTPRRLYQLLAGPPWRSGVDWGRVIFFWGDERCVPPDHPDSNYRMAREALLDHVPIPPENVHRFEAERPDHDAVARDYQNLLASSFGIDSAGPPPAFDLVLLGMGPDGHTASLFPDTLALNETVRWAVANHVPKFGADRLTLTYPVLNRGREVLFLIAGADKAVVLREALEGHSDPPRFPFLRVRPEGDLFWFLDRAAAPSLPPSQTARNP